jgi:methionyl-tRNA formyltransferase
VRTCLLGSPPFATPILERLATSRHELAAVVTPPDRPRGRGRKVEPSQLVLAAQHHALRVLQPAQPKSADFVGELAVLAPDALVVASYGVILPRAVLELAPHGALNVHASLLPRHRGASPVQAAILCGDRETGVSVQRMVVELDAGDVLLERRIAIGPGTTAPELLAELAELGADALVDALDALESGTAAFRPQDAARVTWAKKIEKEHGHIDFTQPAERIERQVRALAGWPGARCRDPKGRELTVLRAAVVPDARGAPGELLECGPRMLVATGSGALEILELVPAGKRALPAAEFLRGARLERGQRLGSEPPVPSFVVGGC